MLSDVLDKQGTLFNKLQKKITSGIKPIRINPIPTRINTLPSRNKEGFTDKILDEKYNQVADQYTKSQSELQKANMNLLQRLDPKTNSNLGNNITLNNSGINGYVTEQGVFKSYNPTTWADTPGNFGCPPASTNTQVSVNENDQMNSSVPGYTFTTENFPKLLVGQPMQSGTSCGLAGKNIYVNRLVDNPSAQYVGCFSNTNGSDEAEKAMTNLGNMDYTSCLSNALNNGYSYFGMSSSSDGKDQCLVSNNLSDIQRYGAPNALKPVLMWETKTTGNANYCSMTNEGFLAVYDSTNALLFQSNEMVPSCISGGRINNLVATFGGNCKDKYNVETGNATDAILSAAASNISGKFSFLVNGKNIGGNPASGCNKKSWDASYNCGNVSKVSHISNAGGKNASFDCTPEIASCRFAMTLKNNGNACVFQQNRSNNGTIKTSKIWCAPTNTDSDSDSDPDSTFVRNSEFAAKLGKTGTNSLNNGQTLFAGEWIGSNNGAIRLVMQTDGNLCLYSFIPVETCAEKGPTKIVTGVPDINAVYQVTAGGNREVLGKMGYIDQDDVLHPYGENSLAFSDKYTILQNMDSVGNDLTTSANSTMDACKSACSANDSCAGYAFESGANVCYLKNKNMYPNNNSTLVGKSGTTTAVRLRQVKSGITCANGIAPENISSEKYDHYIKGPEATRENQESICNPFSGGISDATQNKANEINDQWKSLGEQMDGGINNYASQTDNMNLDFHNNGEKMMKSVHSYKNTLTGRTAGKNIAPIKEGMTNMQDLSQMQHDSELIVKQQNMRYIYWTLFALGLVTACMVVAKKQ